MPMSVTTVPGLHHGWTAVALSAGHQAREHAAAASSANGAAPLLTLLPEAAAVAAQDPEGDEDEASNGNADDGAGCEASSTSTRLGGDFMSDITS